MLLAARNGDDLVYVGGVGTGFTHRMSADLRRLLEDDDTAGGEPEAEECRLRRTAAGR
ncbi:hypothetical protein [Ensifer adhaerens]|uniref:ATP dependent DNA ligase n=1 Tax=Ensifer adhaerens TaxID=106592 RepID=UPI003CD02109